jgi:heme/copper-type cytochrome/quinol oxidase subunit 2
LLIARLEDPMETQTQESWTSTILWTVGTLAIVAAIAVYVVMAQ